MQAGGWLVGGVILASAVGGGFVGGASYIWPGGGSSASVIDQVNHRVIAYTMVKPLGWVAETHNPPCGQGARCSLVCATPPEGTHFKTPVDKNYAFKAQIAPNAMEWCHHNFDEWRSCGNLEAGCAFGNSSFGSAPFEPDRSGWLARKNLPAGTYCAMFKNWNDRQAICGAMILPYVKN